MGKAEKIVWKEWAGGECPVPPATMVLANLRSHKSNGIASPAGQLRWSHLGSGGDIVSYSVFGKLKDQEPQLYEDREPPVGQTDQAYDKLRAVLDRAFEQAAGGKGKERHANGLPFEEQPMASINRQLGSIDGFIYQAHKKSLEAKRLPDGRAQAELLGAINYLAGAVIALDTWAKKETK